MQIVNLNKKRVCDQSDDKKIVRIKRGDCITQISANKDGTLRIKHFLEKKSS